MLDGAHLPLGTVTAQELARYFPTTNLADIGDELVDGLWDQASSPYLPLALFDAPAHGFFAGAPAALHGGRRRSISSPTSCSRTTIAMWMSSSALPGRKLEQSEEYEGLSCAGGALIARGTANAEAAVADSAWRRHQMPAYHLIAKDGRGISLVNIGVGPANAKTITDHLAVLRPEAWLMIGHCAGLRQTQAIGDYVLASRLSAGRQGLERGVATRGAASGDCRNATGPARGGQGSDRRDR